MLSIVLDDALADTVRRAAATAGQEVNNYAVSVLQKHLEQNEVYQALCEGLKSLPNTTIIQRSSMAYSLVVCIPYGDRETEDKIYRLEQSLYRSHPNALFEVTVEEVPEPLPLDKRELSRLPAGIG